MALNGDSELVDLWARAIFYNLRPCIAWGWMILLRLR